MSLKKLAFDILEEANKRLVEEGKPFKSWKDYEKRLSKTIDEILEEDMELD